MPFKFFNEKDERNEKKYIFALKKTKIGEKNFGAMFNIRHLFSIIASIYFIHKYTWSVRDSYE